MIHVHATNATLARTLDLIDPFVVTGNQKEEETAIAAGFETQLERETR